MSNDRPRSRLRSEAARNQAGDLPLRVRLWSGLAWSLLILERFLRHIAPAAGVVALFGIFALFDLFSLVPLWLHWGLLGLFAVGFGAALWFGLRGWRWPSHDEALRRLEADSGFRAKGVPSRRRPGRNPSVVRLAPNGAGRLADRYANHQRSAILKPSPSQLPAILPCASFLDEAST